MPFPGLFEGVSTQKTSHQGRGCCVPQLVALKDPSCVDITCSFPQKSGESSSQLSQEQKSVFDEDLQKKIEENERLHIQVTEDGAGGWQVGSVGKGTCQAEGLSSLPGPHTVEEESQILQIVPLTNMLSCAPTQ